MFLVIVKRCAEIWAFGKIFVLEGTMAKTANLQLRHKANPHILVAGAEKI